jgi:prolyl 4-hydroxylase
VWTEPGDLDRFFWSLVRNETYRERYRPSVLSGPADAVSEYGTKGVDQAVASKTEDGPWVVQLEGFLSPAECDRLIALGHAMGYVRSKDIGKKKFDGTFDSFTSNQRTSTTAWCSRDSVCDRDPVTKAVTARIEELVQIPANHSEYMQLLRYEVGQKYGIHHDYSDLHSARPQGARILTVFLYLSDEGLEGGGTNFPSLNLTVQPRLGRAIVWPSVRNDKPGAKDERVMHQALPVEVGVKFGANAWVHERDFRTPHREGCAN